MRRTLARVSGGDVGAAGGGDGGDDVGLVRLALPALLSGGGCGGGRGGAVQTKDGIDGERLADFAAAEEVVMVRVAGRSVQEAGGGRREGGGRLLLGGRRLLGRLGRRLLRKRLSQFHGAVIRDHERRRAALLMSSLHPI